MQIFKDQKYKIQRPTLEFLQDRVITRENERKESLYDGRGAIVEINFVYDEIIYSNIEYVEKGRLETQLVREENAQLKEQLGITVQRVDLTEEVLNEILLGGIQ